MQAGDPADPSLRPAHVVLPAAPGTGALTVDSEPEGHCGGRPSAVGPHGSWMVWDGQVLLDYNPNGEPAYTRVDDPNAGQRPVYVLREGSPSTDEGGTGPRQSREGVGLDPTGVDPPLLLVVGRA
ncbi:hypothetical protein GCM10023176_39590 [Micromonospora coerulea]|uniref:Uncharacterized protein n=1 Tax=Micromonospora coerulea TaxID=47856 RepID=A0ABP8SQH0_9ACTN